MTISSSLPPRNKPMPCMVLIRSFGLHLNLYLHNPKSAVVVHFLLSKNMSSTVHSTIGCSTTFPNAAK
jgi:hypothetical protein